MGRLAVPLQQFCLPKKGDQTAFWETELALLDMLCHGSGVPQAHLMTQKLSTGPGGPQAGMTSFPGSEIAEDADVSEVGPVAVGVEAEEEGPLEGDEAPDAGEVVAGWVFETLVLGDGQCQEGAEGRDGDG